MNEKTRNQRKEKGKTLQRSRKKMLPQHGFALLKIPMQNLVKAANIREGGKDDSGIAIWDTSVRYINSTK